MGKDFVANPKRKSMADFIMSADERGMLNMNQFKTKKLEDYQRLRESGLPVWDDFETPYHNFNENNKSLANFLLKYDLFILRGIPHTSKFKKINNRGVKDFKECYDFLSQEIKPKDADKYSVLLTEWEPTSYGGIIITKTDRVVVEVAKELDEIEHGQTIPATGYLNDLGMKYTTENLELRKLMWNSLKYVRGLEGYFEFVVTEKDRKIKFIDYKTSKGYLG